jgi:hypothetical protein
MASEYEMRARLTRQRYDKICNDLGALLPKHADSRCFIDFTTVTDGIAGRTRDIRIRVTNGIPELIVKVGMFGAPVREEAVARIFPDDLAEALSVMALLGFSKGVCCARRIVRVSIGDLEIALQEVVDVCKPDAVLDQFVEVEFIGGSVSDDYALNRIRSELRRWCLEPLSLGDWNEYVAELNEKSSFIYKHGETSIDLVRRLGTR